MRTEQTHAIIILMREKITIDDLTFMAQKGFWEVAHVTAAKEDVPWLEGQMATLEERMAAKEDVRIFREETNARFDHLDARVGSIEADIHELQ